MSLEKMICGVNYTVNLLRDNVNGLIDTELTASLNAKYLASAWVKLNSGQDLSIVCQGDSLTAGFDQTSQDSEPPTNGDNRNHAKVQYPLALSNIMSDITGQNISVLNRGFSGDTARIGFDRWNEEVSGDVVHLMYGVNDASGAYSATYEEYLEYIEKLIIRYVGWGFGVVINLTPFKLFNSSSDLHRAYSESLFLLARKYSCPVFDGSDFSQYTAFEGIYSDEVHFNSHGYQKFASSLSSFICCGGWVGKESSVKGSLTLGFGGGKGFGFFSKGVSGVNSENGSFLRNGVTGGPIAAGGQVTWSFYQDCDVLEFSTVGLVSGIDIKFGSPLEPQYDGDERGFLAINKTQVRSNDNKSVSETTSYSMNRNGKINGELVIIGRTVGKGWKTVTVKRSDSATGNKYVASLFANETNNSTMQGQIKNGNGVLTGGKYESYIYQYPYPENGGVKLADAALPAVVSMPVPSGLVPSASSDYNVDFDFVPVEVSIFGNKANQYIKGFVSRVDNTSTLSFTVISQGSAAADMIPASVVIEREAYDKTTEEGTGTLAQGFKVENIDNLWLSLLFTNSTPSQYVITVNSIHKGGFIGF